MFDYRTVTLCRVTVVAVSGPPEVRMMALAADVGREKVVDIRVMCQRGMSTLKMLRQLGWSRKKVRL